ncbi:L-threonylcarbamoyladenylate synthase [Nibrella viscosa]|uniref:L-threonylcarbamoyladenylate synthase n=1 Tax=Nibrella viscosa TaxID=1084524 RepID=A0ABP8KBA4_9BACT
MIPTARDTAFLLRQGKLIGLADETGWSVAADPINDAAVERLLQLHQGTPGALPLTVLIDKTDLLGMYVQNVPEVAWDIVEFAEKPLTVLYGPGKNLSPVLLNQQTTIAVRRVLQADVQRLINSFGRGLLTLSFEAAALPPAAVELTVGTYGTPATPLRKPRIMRLGVNGELEFIRK